MPSYLEIARQALRQSDLHEQFTPERVAGSEDPYAERMQAAIQEVNRPDYPAGMVPWLEQTYPFLYRKLIDTIPNELHRLWSQHKPLEQFERVLQEWISTHEQGCALCRAHLAKQGSR